MTIDELISKVRESLHARVVYAEPVEKDGLTVIPAAVVLGGGGGGSGRVGDAREGDGGGFGLVARPAGAFVIQNGTVRWQPALDVTRLIGAGVLAVVALTGRRRRRRARTRLRG
jgi:uncharacterized spore protein YtfJ